MCVNIAIIITFNKLDSWNFSFSLQFSLNAIIQNQLSADFHCFQQKLYGEKKTSSEY